VRGQSPSQASGDYEVRVQTAGGTKLLRARAPSVALASGALGEGEHTLWFTAPGGRQSPKTVVAIRFDNTAPTAQFFPSPHREAAAGFIPIDGVTVAGAKVSAAGKVLAVDEHGRFRGAVAPLTGDDAVAVRIETPHGESHYYIKRREAVR
jgi:hypothetical protein